MSKCDFNKVALNVIEITLRHGCSPVNLLHIFRTPFPKNASGGLLLTRRRVGSRNVHNISKCNNTNKKTTHSVEETRPRC